MQRPTQQGMKKSDSNNNDKIIFIIRDTAKNQQISCSFLIRQPETASSKSALEIPEKLLKSDQ